MNNVPRHVLTKPWSSEQACFVFLARLLKFNEHGSKKVISKNNTMSEREKRVLSTRHIHSFDSLSC